RTSSRPRSARARSGSRRPARPRGSACPRARVRPETPSPAQTAAAREAVAVIDFGAQYSQLIARRIRECNVYCELLPPDASEEEIARLNPRAFVLSGGPASVYEPGAARAPDLVFDSGKPVR